MRRFLPILVALCLLPSTIIADEPPKTWVVTISAQNFPKLSADNQLRFCDRDAEEFAMRLREGNRFPTSQLLQLNQRAGRNLQPTKANLLREVPAFLSKTRPADSVIMFLSSHLIQLQSSAGDSTGPDGVRTCLLPSDVDPSPARLIDSLIDIRWLRDLLCREIQARRVVLILDACHSGGIQGFPQTLAASDVSPKSIELVFEQALQPALGERSNRCIYVLTSCDEAESSLEAPDLQHGLFTHWLLAGLSGAADANGDAVVTMDELYDLVHQQVPQSAAWYGHIDGRHHCQTPQRYFFGSDHGDLPLVNLAPLDVRTFLDRLSNVLHDLLRHSPQTLAGTAQKPVVGILEFAPESGSRSGSDLDSFAVIVRREIENRLISHLRSADPRLPSYGVVSQSDVIARSPSIGLEELRSGNPIADLSAGQKPVHALVSGQFCRQGQSVGQPGPDRLVVDVRVRSTSTGELLGKFQMTVLINEQLLALLGRSSDVQQLPDALPARLPLPKPAATPMAQFTPSSRQEQRVQLHQTAGNGVNPQAPDESRHASVAVRVFQKRPGQEEVLTPWLPIDPDAPNQLAFATAHGNQLRLELENQTADFLAIMVKIDGVNQIGGTVALPQDSLYWLCPQGATVNVERWLPVPSVSPDSAHMQLQGAELMVVSPPQSVAGRMKHTESLGQIQVLVYGTRTRSREARSRSRKQGETFGIGEGRTGTVRYPVIRDREIDLNDFRAVYVLRYVDAE
ncbi:MAG: caspase domain-containing protein [Planctomycetota bacterium]